MFRPSGHRNVSGERRFCFFRGVVNAGATEEQAHGGSRSEEYRQHRRSRGEKRVLKPHEITVAARVRFCVNSSLKMCAIHGILHISRRGRLPTESPAGLSVP